MKKILLVLVVAMSLILSACAQNVSAAPLSTSTASTSTASNEILNTNYDGAASIATQLALGTLSLDGTTNAITADQAATLLTLWQSLQEETQKNMPGGGNGKGGMPGGQGGGMPGQGNSSSTPDKQSTPVVPPTPSSTDQSSTPATNDAQKQANPIITKIEAAMTTAQLQAIADMKITKTSAETIMKAKGITTVKQGTPSANGNSASGTPEARPTQDGTQMAMPTPDGTRMPMPAANGTPQAGGTGKQPGNGQGGNGMRGGADRLEPGVLDALVKYLANLAGVTLPTATVPSN
jgi:hypothetical protein